MKRALCKLSCRLEAPTKLVENLGFTIVFAMSAVDYVRNQLKKKKRCEEPEGKEIPATSRTCFSYF